MAFWEDRLSESNFSGPMTITIKDKNGTEMIDLQVDNIKMETVITEYIPARESGSFPLIKRNGIRFTAVIGDMKGK